MKQEREMITVLGVGDVILDCPETKPLFDETCGIIRNADIAIGQIEVPHTDRPQLSTISPSPAAAADPKNLAAFAEAGFDIATTSGNHTFDQGQNGVLDTLDMLHALGVATTGTGANLAQARAPAYAERKGIRVAVFEYNCNGPKEAWASPLKAGGAFIRVSTSYEFNGHEPGSLPTEIYTVADPRNLDDMRKDFSEAKENCDIIIAAFHIGRMLHPELLQCQTQITHYAIDCGAQMVMCHHPHALQGIELYKGRPIFHSLGHFAVQTCSLFENEEYKKLRMYNPFAWPGVVPDCKRFREGAGEVINYPFGETSRKTIIAKGIFTKDGLAQASVIPCYIDKNGHPIPKTKDNGGQEILDHILNLNRIERLNTRFEWNSRGDEAVILESEPAQEGDAVYAEV